MSSSGASERSRLIERAGQILFGSLWRAPFCDTFDIGDRRLRRMLKGQEEIPAGLLHDVETALRDHGTHLDALLCDFP
jgi:hypothetical protein